MSDDFIEKLTNLPPIEPSLRLEEITKKLVNNFLMVQSLEMAHNLKYPKKDSKILPLFQWGMALGKHLLLMETFIELTGRPPTRKEWERAEKEISNLL